MRSDPEAAALTEAFTAVHACPCSIRIETPEQSVTEALDVPNIGVAYDLCRQRLNETPGATLAHLYVNDMLIHTLKRRG